MNSEGVAAGVPFVVRPPSDHDPNAPVVLAWHLLDAPRNERSFAAALPLDGLEAWRVYLGLPLTGSRWPDGGVEAFMQLGYADAPLNLYGPITEQAVAEVEPALAAVRARFGLATDAPLALLGGSHGAAVALDVLASGALESDATVLVSPLVQLRPMVTALGEFYGVTYQWSPASDAVADRIDYVARADAVAPHTGPVRIITGAEDRPAILEPAAALAGALRARGVQVDEQSIAGMAHEVAEPPGDDPAPQTASAVRVDALAAAWFRDRWGQAASA